MPTWSIIFMRQSRQFADRNPMPPTLCLQRDGSYATHPVLTKGWDLFKDRKGILSRWAEHIEELLNQTKPTDKPIVDQLPQLPNVSEPAFLPSLEEISASACNLKNNKALDPDGILTEIVKHGVHLLLLRLHSIISAWA